MTESDLDIFETSFKKTFSDISRFREASFVNNKGKRKELLEESFFCTLFFFLGFSYIGSPFKNLPFLYLGLAIGLFVWLWVLLVKGDRYVRLFRTNGKKEDGSQERYVLFEEASMYLLSADFYHKQALTVFMFLLFFVCGVAISF